jgi:epoxyqueuosine reductase
VLCGRMASPLRPIAEEANALGFPLVGASPLGPLPLEPFLIGWLGEGRAGEMGYLARRTAMRVDPRRAMPWARSVVMLAFPYRPPPSPAGDWRTTLRGRIAAYAAGTDYHRRLRCLLRTLQDRLTERVPGARFLSYVDTGAVLEREWALRAGIGWIGRHTLALHRSAGSYFFLAELFTDLTLEPAPLPADHCGSCTRCVAACPTGAIDPDGYTMDPRRCISYLTIELRSAIPIALRPQLGNWIFGCDVCQEVCPWNGGAGASARDDDSAPYLPALLALDAAAFDARFAHTAVARAKRRGLLRNVAVALGNSGNPEAVPALLGALRDQESLVRGHAAWALGRLGGRAARRALEDAEHREDDPSVRNEIQTARGG